MSKYCIIHRLGLVPYDRAWKLQDALAGEIAAGERPPTLLLLEHPHTYTFGRQSHAENLLWNDSVLKKRGVSVHWVDRGGDVTYHGPGQLVGYPLLPLAPGGLRVGVCQGGSGAEGSQLPKVDYVGYLRKLEIALIGALRRLGMESRQVEGLTGVWVDCELKFTGYEIQNFVRKIASIGVKVDVKGISRHGFALNINPDMSYWEGIIGCGLADYHETSLAELNPPVPNMERVMDALVRSFGKVFDFQMHEELLKQRYQS